MIAVTIGRAVASALGHVLVDSFSSQIREGIAGTKDAWSEVWSAKEAPDLNGEGASWVAPVALAGAAVAAGLLLVPKFRTKILDFNDGALRRVGHRIRHTFGGDYRPEGGSRSSESGAASEDSSEETEESPVSGLSPRSDLEQTKRDRARAERSEARREAHVAARAQRAADREATARAESPQPSRVARSR